MFCCLSEGRAVFLGGECWSPGSTQNLRKLARSMHALVDGFDYYVSKKSTSVRHMRRESIINVSSQPVMISGLRSHLVWYTVTYVER